jgi:outer membrane protein OmpA-like peptidoglycan-associated protein
VLLSAALLAACGSAPRRDLDYDRLHASLQALATDPELAKLALAERALAEAAVRRLDASSINAKEHAQLSYLAERRVDIAYIVAQTERENARLTQLQREQADLLLAASRRETEAARAELDRQRRDELLRQEEVERGGVPAAAVAKTPSMPAVPAAAPPAASLPDIAMSRAPSSDAAATVGSAGGSAVPAPASDAATSAVVPAPPASTTTFPTAPAPATPAAPTEAAADSPLAQRLSSLAPDADGEGRQITLEDLVFEPGTATFAAGAEVGLARVAGWLAASPALPVRVEGHTDATGSPEANLTLSLRRAEAVRDALVARGVAAARIVVSGEGAADPVASNDDAQGRARNRRVVIRLLGSG